MRAIGVAQTRIRRKIRSTYGFVADPGLSYIQKVSFVFRHVSPRLLACNPLNAKYHNLCEPDTAIPSGTQNLLGLGLNFIPNPLRSSDASAVQLTRFIRDVHTRAYFVGDREKVIPKLFIRSHWEPKEKFKIQDLAHRLELFSIGIRHLFQAQPIESNLLRIQMTALRSLKSSKDLIVFKTDKNLGPAIIERNRYINRALEDHLLDKTTYSRLSPTTATGRVDTIEKEIRKFIKERLDPESSDAKYLTRQLEQVVVPYAHFYLLAKIHKDPWKTRPIVSISGSILQGLGRWVDAQLQPVCRHIQYQLQSSVDLIQQLKERRFNPEARFFSMDAVSMYTNINTDHALNVIGDFLFSTEGRNICRKEKVDPSATLAALRLVMTSNVFKFGDTFWEQRSGTAMGTPPAVVYAKLYFFLHEREFVSQFPELLFYGRFIDDVLGVWNASSSERWVEFQQIVNDYGTLRWEFMEFTKSIDFLDLTLSLTEDGRVTTSLYEKALNLYLYLPPHSAHAGGVLSGLVYGMIYRIYRLTSEQDQCQNHINKLFCRLRARGHTRESLQPLFEKAIFRVLTRGGTEVEDRLSDTLFLHLHFNPGDLSSRVIQRLFRLLIAEPPNKLPISVLENHKGVALGFRRLTVAYHSHRNIGSLLSPRRLRSPGTDNDEQVSRYLDGSVHAIR